MSGKARPYSEASNAQLQREFKRWANRLKWDMEQADIARQWIAMLTYEEECRKAEKAAAGSSSAIKGAQSAVRRERSVLHSVMRGIKKDG